MTHFILFLYLNSFNLCSPNYFNSALLLCLSSIWINSDWDKDRELSHDSLSYLICLLSSELIPSLCSRGRQLSCSFSQKQDSTSNYLQCVSVSMHLSNWHGPSSCVPISHAVVQCRLWVTFCSIPSSCVPIKTARARSPRCEGWLRQVGGRRPPTPPCYFTRPRTGSKVWWTGGSSFTRSGLSLSLKLYLTLTLSSEHSIHSHLLTSHQTGTLPILETEACLRWVATMSLTDELN